MTVAADTAASQGAPHAIDPATLHQWLANDGAVLVDVREPAEHAAEHIAGATLAPLSTFDSEQLPDPGAKKLVLHCKSGSRSRMAAQRLLKRRRAEVWLLTGGIEAWRASGLPTVAGSQSGTLFDVQRQTQVTIGAGVLAGTLLGAFVSPWWLILAGFFGCGLLFAGLSGTCGLAMALAKMPWNRRKE